MTQPDALNNPTHTLGAVLDAVARRLAAAGIETPKEDARRLIAAVVKCEPIDFILHPDRILGADVRRYLDGYVDRRTAREPVSRILGERDFYGRSYEINAATLDPRPDSETLIEAAVEVVEAEGWRDRALRILDIGTGSGCLLIALLNEFPNSCGLGTDISSDALAVAGRNAKRHGVSARATFEMRRSLEGMVGPFDLIVSNPPYIETQEIAGLDPEVREYDPLGALDGGPDGLAVYREIAGALGGVMANGWAIFEIGAGQSEGVTKILRTEDLIQNSLPIRSWRDLNGHTRCVAVRIHKPRSD